MGKNKKQRTQTEDENQAAAADSQPSVDREGEHDDPVQPDDLPDGGVEPEETKTPQETANSQLETVDAVEPHGVELVAEEPPNEYGNDGVSQKLGSADSAHGSDIFVENKKAEWSKILDRVIAKEMHAKNLSA